MLDFRYYFTPLIGVLFIFRSRYYSLPVVEEYLALRGGPRRFAPGFPCLVLLGRAIRRPSPFAYGAITRCGGTFQDLWLGLDFVTPAPSCNWMTCFPRHRLRNACRLTSSRFRQSSPFARRYLGNRGFFLFLGLLRCFSSPRSPPRPMDSAVDAKVLPWPVSGFGHLRVNAWLAAHRSLTQPSHVLHRLSTPEHPPSTLSNLTTFLKENLSFARDHSDRLSRRDVKTTPRIVKDRSSTSRMPPPVDHRRATRGAARRTRVGAASRRA